jgi:hypothetical protein
MALPNNHPLSELVVHGYSSSLGATPITAYMRAPTRGKIIEVGVIQNGTVTGTATVTTAVNGAAIAGGALTVTAGGAGALFSANPTAANDVNEGDVISFAPSGATGTVTGYCYAVIRKSA